MPRGDGETILIVDDEVSILTVTSRTLAAYGYKVLTATNGVDAVALYASHRKVISVVLTDMMMPIMGGPEMIHALKRMSPSLKIIAASGLNTDGRPEKVAAAGVRYFLTKPYTTSHLLTTIQTLLDEA